LIFFFFLFSFFLVLFFQGKSEKVPKERQSRPGTKALHKRSNQGLVQINCLKIACTTSEGDVLMADQLAETKGENHEKTAYDAH
jgi:hypothetical protein